MFTPLPFTINPDNSVIVSFKFKVYSIPAGEIKDELRPNITDAELFLRVNAYDVLRRSIHAYIADQEMKSTNVDYNMTKAKQEALDHCRKGRDWFIDISDVEEKVTMFKVSKGWECCIKMEKQLFEILEPTKFKSYKTTLMELSGILQVAKLYYTK